MAIVWMKAAIEAVEFSFQVEGDLGPKLPSVKISGSPRCTTVKASTEECDSSHTDMRKAAARRQLLYSWRRQERRA